MSPRDSILTVAPTVVNVRQVPAGSYRRLRARAVRRLHARVPTLRYRDRCAAGSGRPQSCQRHDRGSANRIASAEACGQVGVSRRTIYNWMASGKVEYVRTAGGAVRIFSDTLWRTRTGAAAGGRAASSREAAPSQSDVTGRATCVADGPGDGQDARGSRSRPADAVPPAEQPAGHHPGERRAARGPRRPTRRSARGRRRSVEAPSRRWRPHATCAACSSRTAAGRPRPNRPPGPAAPSHAELWRCQAGRASESPPIVSTNRHD